MRSRLSLPILRQPDDETCGPTCLHAVYRYFGDPIGLSKVISETPRLDGGGTLAVHLARHALKRGYRATIYTFNLQVFDPSWFTSTSDLKERLQAQLHVKKSTKLHRATKAYLDFLDLGGEIRYEDLTRSLLRSHLNDGLPLLTGLCATYLYRSKRELGDGPKVEYDDLRGQPMGHFVVVHGYDRKTRRATVADPYENPFSKDRSYQVDIDRLVGSIMLGVLTHDANILVIEPKEWLPVRKPTPKPRRVRKAKAPGKRVRRKAKNS